MRLAGQLLAVSAVTLLLPWAGCQYAREIETTLRDGEEQALISTARLLGAALAPSAGEFAADPERWSAARGRSADIYAHALDQVPTLDGFVEDWGLDPATMERFGGMELLAARRGAFVHLFVTSTGDAMPAALEVRGRQASLEFVLEAPGAVTASARGTAPDPRARGYWQPTSRGWQLEARLPEALLQDRLGVRLRSQGGTVIGATFTAAPGWITGPDRVAQAALEALAPPGQRAYVADRGGFILAAHGPRRGARAAPQESVLEPLYRRVLGRRLEADPPPAARPGQLSGRHLELAVLGAVDARRYAVPGGSLLAAAAPVGTPGTPFAVVVVERDTAEILSLTSAPTRRLLGLSLFASLGAAAVLLGFGAVLSLRIRRLRDAAAGAIGLRGEVRGPMPGARADDELGDLARNFDRLLGRVREHNLYLQSLGGRLAHELRTPLAVVRSSLDNLEAESATAGPWLGRAREGVDRMSGLVNALSAARRIERAIGTAEHERFDLAAQLEDMTAAYRALHPERRFELHRPPQPCLLEGTPDLVAQALDKLVENAVDFAPPDVPIRLQLDEAGDCWRLTVANAGSRLPPGPTEPLFDSLVSHREDDTGSHLGLGLFIVRLVAEHHGGRATARNLPDEPGVEFAMELRRTAGTPAQP